MLKFSLPLTLILASLSGCSRSAVIKRTEASSQSTTTQTEQTSPTESQGKRQALQKQIEQIASLAKGRVGVSAMILETGEVVTSLDNHGHFPMQSVYKLP